MTFDPHISDDRFERLEGPTPSIEKAKTHEDSGVDSGSSTIEKSRFVTGVYIPPMQFPHLESPHEQDLLAVSLKLGKDSKVNFLTKAELEGQNVSEEVIKSWSANIEEIARQVQERLNSPYYQSLQKILDNGGPVQGIAPGNVVDASSFLANLNRLHDFDKVPPTAKVDETNPAKAESSGILVLPLAGAMMAGGVFILGSVDPLSKVMELVQAVQTITPTAVVSYVVPLVNVMALGPLYTQSWNEAISRFRNKNQKKYQQLAVEFAKDILKIVSNPTFIRENLINKMLPKNTSQEVKDRLEGIVKVIVCGMSLSLLYTVYVGKILDVRNVQNTQFLGMEPLELRDYLNGTLEMPKRVDGKKLSEVEEYAEILLERTRLNLALIENPEDRFFAIDHLLEFISEAQDADPMFEPVKVFDNLCASLKFDPNERPRGSGLLLC